MCAKSQDNIALIMGNMLIRVHSSRNGYWWWQWYWL